LGSTERTYVKYTKSFAASKNPDELFCCDYFFLGNTEKNPAACTTGLLELSTSSNSFISDKPPALYISCHLQQPLPNMSHELKQMIHLLFFVAFIYFSVF
jgi:hypothetical protein